MFHVYWKSNWPSGWWSYLHIQNISTREIKKLVLGSTISCIQFDLYKEFIEASKPSAIWNRADSTRGSLRNAPVAVVIGEDLRYLCLSNLLFLYSYFVREFCYSNSSRKTYKSGLRLNIIESFHSCVKGYLYGIDSEAARVPFRKLVHSLKFIPWQLVK